MLWFFRALPTHPDVTPSNLPAAANEGNNNSSKVQILSRITCISRPFVNLPVLLSLSVFNSDLYSLMNMYSRARNSSLEAPGKLMGGILILRIMGVNETVRIIYDKLSIFPKK